MISSFKLVFITLAILGVLLFVMRRFAMGTSAPVSMVPMPSGSGSGGGFAGMLKYLVLLVVVGFLLRMMYHQFVVDDSVLTSLNSGQSMQTINPSALAASSSSSGNTSNFTYSIWFFVDDWNYRYGEPKMLFGRMTAATGTKEPCPSVTLGAVQNNLSVQLTVYPGADDAPMNNEGHSLVYNCLVPNVPIQRWCNVMISVYGRTLDVYLDGKLVKTCVLPGIAKIDNNASIFVTPLGGFAGWTSLLQYWPDSSNPQQAWNVYKKGYGGSWFGSLFGRYSLKVSIMDGNNETNNFTV